MRAFLLGNSLWFFAKHESFDGKDSSRRSTNYTIALSPREVHESGSLRSLRAVVREIDNTRAAQWGGRWFERARGDALSADARRTAGHSSAERSACVCVNMSLTQRSVSVVVRACGGGRCLRVAVLARRHWVGFPRCDICFAWLGLFLLSASLFFAIIDIKEIIIVIVTVRDDVGRFASFHTYTQAYTHTHYSAQNASSDADSLSLSLCLADKRCCSTDSDSHENLPPRCLSGGLSVAPQHAPALSSSSISTGDTPPL